MTRLCRVLLTLTILAGSVYSCARLPFGPLRPGEVRLVRLEIPERMDEGLFYEAVLRIRSDAAPMVKQVCFRYLAEVPSVAHPSMYWYSYESASDEAIGSAGSRWLAAGPYSDFSNIFCVGADQVRLTSTDRVVVRFQAKGLKPQFNALECYIEYLLDGRLKESNRVRARITQPE